MAGPGVSRPWQGRILKMAVLVDVDHRTALGVVRDQGARPTCLAMAATTAHEFARGTPSPLSPEYLHYHACFDLEESSDGVTFADIARSLLSPGQPTERNCPYRSSDPPPSWHPPTGIPLYRRHSDLVADGGGRIEGLVRAGRLPVAGISIPPGLFNPTRPWIVDPEGPVRGFHAVVIVGIGAVDGVRCFLIRNSWGSSWGMDGHAWLTESFIRRHLRHLLVLSTEAT